MCVFLGCCVVVPGNLIYGICEDVCGKESTHKYEHMCMSHSYGHACWYIPFHVLSIALWLWASYLTSWCLGFPNEMARIIAPSPWGCYTQMHTQITFLFVFICSLAASLLDCWYCGSRDLTRSRSWVKKWGGREGGNEWTTLTNPLAHVLMFRHIDVHICACDRMCRLVCKHPRVMHAHTQTCPGPELRRVGLAAVSRLCPGSQNTGFCLGFHITVIYYVTLGRSF